MDDAPDNSDPAIVVALNRLEQRFPAQPSVQAAILRELSIRSVTLSARATDMRFAASADLSHATQDATPPRPAVLIASERAALNGERLDPENAFFPLMHAVTLFARRDDDAACAEFARAASLPHFDDYPRDEAEGAWRLAEDAVGAEPGPTVRELMSASVYFEHMWQIQGAARLAVLKAMHDEQSGDGARTVEGGRNRPADGPRPG